MWERKERRFSNIFNNHSGTSLSGTTGTIKTSLLNIVHSHSVDPRKLCVGIKYYIVHMYSIPYYTYGSTANFLVLERTALICISKERRCNEDLRGVKNFTIE